uniref:thiamine pyrophosphate-dependent enzyme n=1 Tax=Haloactinopolyspora sp. TaxID=1966353 RepID=UPI00261E780C
VEAHTYRVEPHTNADDDSRYRDHDEVEEWKRRDPIDRLAAYLRSTGELTDDDAAAAVEEGEALVADLRTRMAVDPVTDPRELFEHVYAEPTPQLAEQAGWLAEELSAGGER